MKPLEKDHDSIAAIATASGRAGIAVVRLSGPESITIAKAVFKSVKDPSEHVRSMIYGHVHDQNGPLDEALLCYMKAPSSYTGEDVVEIQCHGGNTAASAILTALIENGARVADPGEFTRRAFLNGRIDLVQAESVMELVNAASHEHLLLAERLMDGVFSRRIESILNDLENCIALLEMNINFPTQGIEGVSRETLEASLSPVLSTLDNMIASYRSGKKIRDGFTVVLAGSVNAGKSSLFNAILGRKRAIVTPVPGTTRDWIEEKIELDGQSIILIDTAGMRETEDEIEREGVAESGRLIGSSDIVIHCVASDDNRKHSISYLDDHNSIIHVISKADLTQDTTHPNNLFPVSAVTGEGIENLLDALSSLIKTFLDSSHTDAIVMIERHQRELIAARDNIRRALESINSHSEEVTSYELQEALTHIETIIGRLVDIDILDTIFSNFCIGK